jgi:hypothetical protein
MPPIAPDHKPVGGVAMVSRKVFEDKNLPLVAHPKVGNSARSFGTGGSNEPQGAGVKSLADKKRLTFKLESKRGRCFLAGAGDINLDYNLFEYGTPGQAIGTYVHEVTHKFAGTKDEGDNSGYFKFFDRQYRPKLVPRQAWINADSYAWLLYDYFHGDDVAWEQ